MFVILIYDIIDENKNNNKILNLCRQYLFHIQDSCFHGYISHKNLKDLKIKINKLIVKGDNIIIYELSTDKYLKIQEIGDIKVQRTTIVQ